MSHLNPGKVASRSGRTLFPHLNNSCHFSSSYGKARSPQKFQKVAGRGTPLSVTPGGTAVHVLCPHCPPWDVTVPAHGFPCPKYHKLIDNVCTSISYTNNVICPKSKFSPFLKTAADFTMKGHGTVWEASLSLGLFLPIPHRNPAQAHATPQAGSSRTL